MFYEKIVRPIAFRTDPETIHHRVIKTLGLVSGNKLAYNLAKPIFEVSDEKLKTRIGKLEIKNPVGLAAGFDKYIEAPLAYPMLGFGFAELGSITFSEQPGNPKPRLWRIPDDKGLIVYYGLANAGAQKTGVELSKLKTHPAPLGISIAPTTGLQISEMADDYTKTFLKLHSFADHITFNVSCPNVAACDMFSQISFILELIEKAAKTAAENNIAKDLFLKIGPHHSEEDLRKIVDACVENNFTGIITTNLIKNRGVIQPTSSKERLDHPGGISGKLTQKESERTLRTAYHLSQGKLKIIGVGGIFTADDAYRKIKLGASALQLITGFIYGGPFAIKNINKGLIELLEKDGFKSIAEAVGKAS